MYQFYKRPALLIEFDEAIPFQLIDKTPSESVSAQSIISKISLLTLHFPTLQLIWSRSPSHTAEIFHELKKSAT